MLITIERVEVHMELCEEFKLNEKRNKMKKEIYIKVPGSDLKFLKPNFECELFAIRDNKIYGMINDNGNKKSTNWNLDGIGLMFRSTFHLTPYIESNPWYDNENNFPRLLVLDMDTENKYNFCNSKESFLYISSFGYRVADNEEIDSLKMEL